MVVWLGLPLPVKCYSDESPAREQASVKVTASAALKRQADKLTTIELDYVEQAVLLASKEEIFRVTRELFFPKKAIRLSVHFDGFAASASS